MSFGGSFCTETGLGAYENVPSVDDRDEWVLEAELAENDGGWLSRSAAANISAEAITRLSEDVNI